MIIIKSKEEIEKIRITSNILRDTHKIIGEAIKPGISTYELDKIAEKYILSKGANPSQKGYKHHEIGMPDFPATICTSINEEIIHGIPEKNRRLKDGDIITIDLAIDKSRIFCRCSKNIYCR